MTDESVQSEYNDFRVHRAPKETYSLRSETDENLTRAKTCDGSSKDGIHDKV